MIPLPGERGCGCGCGGSAVAVAGSPALPTSTRRSSVGRRTLEFAGWLIPGTILAFFPKCPLCVAGYVALATGLGVSLTAATYLRWTLLVLCIASLAFMASRRVVRAMRSRKT